MLRRFVEMCVTTPQNRACFSSSGVVLGRNLVFTKQDVARAKHDPEGYWCDAARRVDFVTPFTRAMPRPETLTESVGQWFEGGTLNMAYNAVDRHALKQPKKIALYYDSPVTNTKRSISYEELLQQVSSVARILHGEFGVQKKDTVIIYMPNMPEAVFTMLACARIGAVHSVVFGGFSAKELSKRILDSNTRVVITCTCGVDGKKVLNYKAFVDSAIAMLPDPSQVAHCGVFRRDMMPDVSMSPNRDVWLNEAVITLLSRNTVSCIPVESDHPFYILYTSGTTGVPKGIVRETAGQAVVLATQIQKVFGIDHNDVIFTASDIGWIVGTNFSVYAPLLNGCTSILYEGKPVGTPDAGAFFRIIQEYKANALFTAPTALRAIKGADPDGLLARQYDTSSLHGVYLGGERTDPNSMHWTESLLGVPVLDNWWQTETGSPITCPPRHDTTNEIIRRAGSCGVACPGWNLEVMETKDVAHGDAGSGISGELVIKLPLPPGALHSIWGRPSAVKDIYLKHPGYFSTFDAGEIANDDGLVSVMARTDDIINVAGHRLSTGQMEGVLCEHEDVAEAAVVGVDCDLRGEKPLGLVVAKRGHTIRIDALESLVRSTVGPIAVIKVVTVAALPKTRSGKVLRRTIRQIATRRFPLEVPATIEDADVIPDLWLELHGEPIPQEDGHQ